MLESRDLATIDEFLAEDFVSHEIPPGLPDGIDGARAFFAMFRDGFPDAAVEIEQIVADGDWVVAATRTTGTHTGAIFGVAPTGRRVSIGAIDMVRVAGGKIVEHRGLTDTVGLMRQLSG